MDANVWTRLNRLLDEALELTPEERTSWLSSLGPEHDAVKPSLVALLAHAHSVAGARFLDTLPPVDFNAGVLEDTAATLVGPYRLLREIGRGGMGTVWLAERSDGTLRRPVALKLPWGAWPRAALAGRMLRERDILAALTHPNIARIYDAGVTPEGRPYLALEYVEGQTIDAYCHAHHLDVNARLRVFLQVARALAYAHAQLVIHRDLKPSNILVSADGQVHLLDFGIAKLLEEGETKETSLSQFAGGSPHTPEYASPEQIAGRPLGTASDVYSLGVVLYELLAGARPYKVQRDSLHALHEAIVQIDPPPPSAVVADPATARTLRGDLDTIVLKALKKRPEERYATVNALADDLQRYLDGLPVAARPDSRLYRLKKLVVRNRIAAAATAATLAAIVAGAAVAAWQAHEARLQRDAAIRERVRADANAEAAGRAARIARANFELTDYLTADIATGRSTTDLEHQLERAIVTVRRQYRDEPLLRLHLLLGIAGRFRQLGSFDRHRALVAELEKTADTAGDESVLAQLRCWKARDLSQGGNAAAARALIDPVIASLRSGGPQSTEILISCLADESAIARLAGDSTRAIAAVEEVRRLEEEKGLVRTDSHTDTLLLLARAYSQAGRYREAAAAAARSVELRIELGREDTPGMMNVRTIQATVFREGGQPQRALPILSSALATHTSRGGAPASIPALEYETGLTLVRLGRAGEALPFLSRAGAAARARGDATMIRASSVMSILALSDTGQLPRAAVLLVETEPLYTRLRAEQQYTARQFLFAGAHLALAQEDAGKASAYLEETRRLLAKLGNEDDPAWRVFHFYAARAALAGRRYDEAATAARAALRLSQQQAIDPEASVFVGEDLLVQADVLLAQGETPRGREAAQRAVTLLEKTAGPKHPAVERARGLAF
jgi:serine/threonine-protein kinase